MEVRDSHFHADVKDLTDVLHRTLHGTGFVPKAANLKRFIPAFLVGLAVVIGIFWLLVQRRMDSGKSRATGLRRCSHETSCAELGIGTAARPDVGRRNE